MKVMLVCGTRPEIIKSVSFYRECKSKKDMDVVYVNTGQHRDMAPRWREFSSPDEASISTRPYQCIRQL